MPQPASADYRLFLGHVDYRPDVAAVYGSMFEQSHADGIIVMGDIQGGDAALDDLAERHLYVVGVSDRIERRRVPGVYVDNVAGTKLAMDHLWKSRPPHDRVRHRPAHRGRPIAGRGVPGVHAGAGRGRSRPRLLHDPARPVTELPARTRALRPLRSTDTTHRALRSVRHDGDRSHAGGIPGGNRDARGLSIVGFDDIDIAAFTIPPLTTVSQSGVEMGSIAANMVFDMIEHETPGPDTKDVVVNPTLVVRQSTAPVG